MRLFNDVINDESRRLNDESSFLQVMMHQVTASRWSHPYLMALWLTQIDIWQLLDTPVLITSSVVHKTMSQMRDVTKRIRWFIHKACCKTPRLSTACNPGVAAGKTDHCSPGNGVFHAGALAHFSIAVRNNFFLNIQDVD
ncbi:hypothetical protein TNCV_4471841 [Trichonephila clavipes]|uniref:Uncharacterized protein n=1 Tax=Trichonephila clavipes TaxID=2585209 RepID=A0A8X6VKL9_TRICX|nr:hypothetical protein TNCV_4471841 [Trichonephila clavipes]